MEESAELKMVKAMLRSVLMSCKEGVPAAILQKDYKEVVGDFLPFKKLGFPNLEQFILSIPDVVKVDRRGGEFIFHAVADEATAHIQAMVKKQRSKKVRKPIRRPRGGGAGPWFVQRPPLHHRPPHPGHPGPPPFRGHAPRGRRQGMPSFIAQPTTPHTRIPMSPVTVEIGNSSTGSRTIRVGSSHLLNRAMHEANTDRTSHTSSNSSDRTSHTEQKSSSSSRFELPPRFRKQTGVQIPQSTTSALNRRPSGNSEYSTIEDGDIYMQQLCRYMNDKGHSIKFDTTVGGGGYVSSIVINNETHGSEGIYKAAREAEEAVARVVVQRLNIKQPQESRLPTIDWNDTSKESGTTSTAQSISPDMVVMLKSRVKEILQNKKNGLWGTRIPHEYKERYKEDAPDQLLTLIKTWKDIAKVELVPNTDRDIVYPILEDQSMKLTIPRVQLLTRRSKIRFTEHFRNEKSNEKAVIYMTYVNNPSYFCVQREDSTIEELFDKLQSHCKVSSCPDPSVLQKGQFCAGLYSGDWTRAEILSVNGTDVELLFVDYGNVETVKADSIRWLSEDLVKQSVQGVICSLYGVQPLQGETEWNDKASRMFATEVEEQALIGLPKGFYDDIVDIELYVKSDPSVSVGDKLIQAGVVRGLAEESASTNNNDDDKQIHPTDLNLPEDKEWDVHITYISTSTNSVMVRLVGEEYSDRLDAYQAQLQTAFRNSNTEFPIVVGNTYVAHDDGLYHRCRVISQEGKKVLLYFLDHGDTDTLIPEQLHPIDPAVNKLLPYQAVEVSLYGLEEVSTNITALERMCELALGKTCVAQIVDKEEIPSVILYDTSSDTDLNINENILNTIKEEGGGIDSPSPRNSSPAPGSKSNTPRVMSPITISDSNSVISNSDLSPPKVTGSSAHILGNSPNTKTSPSVTKVPQLSLQTSNLNTNSEDNFNTPSLGLSPSKQYLNNSQTSEQSENRNFEQKGLTTKYIPPPPSETPPSSPIKGSSIISEARINSAIKGRSIMCETRVPEVVEVCDLLTKLKLFPIPEIGECLDVHVNFTHDPSNFVCLPYTEMDRLNELLICMIDSYSQDKQTLPSDSIQVGDIYAGVKDNIWYRVRVTQNVSTDLVSVYQLDIGDYTVLQKTELRPLKPEFTTLPMMAITARLGKIVPKSGGWSEAAKYKFIELAREKDLIALVQGHDKVTGVVDLHLIDTSNENYDVIVNEELVKAGYAVVC